MYLSLNRTFPRSLSNLLFSSPQSLYLMVSLYLSLSHALCSDANFQHNIFNVRYICNAIHVHVGVDTEELITPQIRLIKCHKLLWDELFTYYLISIFSFLDRVLDLKNPGYWPSNRVIALSHFLSSFNSIPCLFRCSFFLRIFHPSAKCCLGFGLLIDPENIAQTIRSIES